MLDRLFREQLLNLLDAQALERGLDDAVEEESEVDEQGEAEDLQPLESLPAEAERDDPDEEGAAGVDGGARGGGDAARDGEAEEVEAAAGGVSISEDGEKGGKERKLTRC